MALARKAFSLPVDVGDFISYVGFARNAASALLRQAACIKFVPTVSGEVMVSGHSVVSSGSGIDFVAQFTSSKDSYTITVANENQYLIPIAPRTAVGTPFKLKGETVALEASGPGTSRSLIFKIRKNLADAGIDATLIDAEVFKTVSGDVDLAAGDNWGLFVDAVNSPIEERQFFTIPGQSLAVSLGTIIVIKDAGGDTSAVHSFLATGGLSPNAFSLAGGQQQTFNDVAVGSGYGFSETPAPGWQQDSVVVSNGSPINNISVAAGEVITVTFVNSLIAPANNASGIYEMIPGKTDDTIWIDVSLGIDVDVAIP